MELRDPAGLAVEFADDVEQSCREVLDVLVRERLAGAGTVVDLTRPFVTDRPRHGLEDAVVARTTAALVEVSVAGFERGPEPVEVVDVGVGSRKPASTAERDDGLASRGEGGPRLPAGNTTVRNPAAEAPGDAIRPIYDR